MASAGSAALGGAASGAALGSMFGPIGTAIGGLGGAAIAGLTAYSQNKKAKKIQALRPNYTRPDEVNQNVNMYSAAANTSKLPAQSLMEDSIKADTAGAFNDVVRSASGNSQVLAALTKLKSNENSSINDLNVQGAMNRQDNMAKLAQARGVVGDYKDQEFDFNKNQPYELELARKRALKGAANANLETMTQDLLNTGSVAYGAYQGGNNRYMRRGPQPVPPVPPL